MPTEKMVQITNHIELTESGQKRWKRQRAATLLRRAFVGCLVVIVLVFPAQVIALVFFFPLGVFKKPRGYSEILFDLTWLLICLMFVAALFGVMILMSSKKLPVLYLRRFGLTAANRRISQAIERGLGRYYRIVTLDDSSFRPIEVPRWQRILSRVGISVVALALAVLAAFLSIEVGGWDPSRTFGPEYGGAVAVYLGYFGFIIGVLGIPLLVILVLLAVVFAWRWLIRRRSRLEVRSRGDIRRCLSRVRQLASWLRRPSIMAPQAVVVTVVDELWQETVSELATHVGLVIVDVSEPTANLIWELEQVFTNAQIVCLLVGDGLMVRKWTEEDGDLHFASTHSRMKALLQARTILVCESQKHFSQRMYARNLWRWLNNIADVVRTC
jgi:hypothetical protein